MTRRRDFLSMTAGAVAARAVLPMAAKAEPVLRGVDPDQSPRLARYSTTHAALADIQAGLPQCLFHELPEGGLRMAARVSPGGGTFKDITMKMAVAEHVLAVQEGTAPHPDAALLDACAAFINLKQQANATFRSHLNDDPGEREMEVEPDRIYGEQDELLTLILDHRAVTLERQQAGGRALLAWDIDMTNADHSDLD